MNRVTFYIIKQVSLVTFFISLGLIGSIWLVQILKLLRYIVQQGCDISTLFEMMFLIIPDLLLLVLPLALFISTLYVYHKLIIDSELIVMRSSGISNFCLAKPTIYFAMMITALLYILHFYIVPLSSAHLRQMRYEVKNNYDNMVLQEGIFNPLPGGGVILIQNKNAEGQLENLFAYINQNGKKPYISIAEQAQLFQDNDRIHMVMANGSRQEKNMENNSISILYFNQATVEIEKKKPDDRSALNKKVSEFTINELFNPSLFATDSYMIDQMKKERFSRILQPLMSLSFILIALVFVLRGKFNRRQNLRQIVATVSTVVGVYAVSFSLIQGMKTYTSFGYLAVAFIVASIILPLIFLMDRIPTKEGGK